MYQHQDLKMSSEKYKVVFTSSSKAAILSGHKSKIYRVISIIETRTKGRILIFGTSIFGFINMERLICRLIFLIIEINNLWVWNIFVLFSGDHQVVSDIMPHSLADCQRFDGTVANQVLVFIPQRWRIKKILPEWTQQQTTWVSPIQKSYLFSLRCVRPLDENPVGCKQDNLKFVHLIEQQKNIIYWVV